MPLATFLGSYLIQTIGITLVIAVAGLVIGHFCYTEPGDD